MGYTPSFTPQYEDGWEDLPIEETPITADALNAYDEAIENIESYLASDESQSNIADAYDATETYSEGDYRIHNGNLYKCLEDIDTPEEWDSTKWESCLITDEMGSGGGGGSSTLAGLTDTDITSPQDGQFLVYNGTSSKWKNITIPNAESEGF